MPKTYQRLYRWGRGGSVPAYTLLSWGGCRPFNVGLRTYSSACNLP